MGLMAWPLKAYLNGIQDDVLTLMPHFPRFRSTTIKWLNKYVPLRKWQSGRTERPHWIRDSLRCVVTHKPMCFQYPEYHREIAIKSSHSSRISIAYALFFSFLLRLSLPMLDKLPKRKRIHMPWHGTSTHIRKIRILFCSSGSFFYIAIYFELIEILWWMPYVLPLAIPWMNNTRTQPWRGAWWKRKIVRRKGTLILISCRLNTRKLNQ